MKQTTKSPLLPDWLRSLLLAVLAFVLISMPVHAFVSTWGGTSIGPLWLWKSWKDLLLAIVGLVVLVYALWKREFREALLRDRLVWTVLALVVLVLVSGGVYRGVNGQNATFAGVAMDVRYLLGAAVAYVVMRFGTRVRFVQWRRYVVGVGVGLAVLGALQVFVLPLEFLSSFGYDKHVTIAPYTLIDDNPNAPRAFATLSGPNDYGAFLLLPLVLAVIAARKRPLAWLAVLAIAGGVYLSGSRSAWLGALVALGIYLFAESKRRFTPGTLWKFAVMGVVAFGCVVSLALVIPAVRLQVFHSSPGDSSLAEGSTDAHWQATLAGLKRVATQPLGCGPGCAGPASFYGPTPKISENYYVQLAEEYGVVGLGLWVWLVVVVVRRLWDDRSRTLSVVLLASFAGLSVIGLWLHVWADDPVSLTWWILAGSVLGYNESRQWKKSKNTSRLKTS